MKKLDIPLGGTSAKILHMVRVQMDNDLDPERLEGELHKRARSRKEPTYGARNARIVRATKGNRCYIVTLINPEALPVIYDILSEIDADLAAAKETQRLLGLLAD